MNEKKSQPDDEMQPEYDLASMGPAVKGKYLESYQNGTNLAKLAPDVRAAFPSDEAVNEALRSLMSQLPH